MRYFEPKSNAKITKLNQGELLIEYIKLRAAYERIQRLDEHLRMEVSLGYAIEYESKEYDTGEPPYEHMDKVIADMEEWLKRAKRMRGHTHEWVDMYGDGRDLSCTCSICGYSET